MVKAMRCKHQQIRREAYLKGGTWGEFKRCVDCGQPVPLGPANDTGFVSYEIYAAMIAVYWAAGIVKSKPPRKEPVPFIAGFTGYEPKKGELENSKALADLYNSGMLARTILDHDK